ncbi:MAG: Lysophospholipase L2 [Nitrospira sp.]|nr:Lysophospholipase L2 [Nitrospira sp.]
MPRKHMSNLWNCLRVCRCLLIFLSMTSCASVPKQELVDCVQFGKVTCEGQLAREEYQATIEQLLDATRHSGTFIGKDGIQLAYERYRQPGHEQDAIVLVIGRAESYVKYHELIYDLYRNGYSVFAYDHRGQGLSDRILKGPNDERKGYVDQFDDYVEDLNTLIEDIVAPTAPRKIFLLAHSMGGAIASLWAEQHPKGADALALSSPMHQPALPGGKWFHRAVCQYYVADKEESKPTEYAGDGPVQLTEEDFTDPEKNDFTHSRIRFERFLMVLHSDPRLRLTGPTWRWVSEACRGSREAVADASKIAMPILLLQAGSDTVVRASAQVTFCENSSRCDGGGVVVIDGAKHELLIESDPYRTEALTRILEFFEKYRSKPLSHEVGSR